MSIPVKLENLVDALTHYRIAYLLTVTDKATPHAVQIDAVLQGGDLVIGSLGKRTRNNVQARPNVSLLWPPESETGYSLIVDGEAELDGDVLRVKPTRAVLHRAGVSNTSGEQSCKSDCVELGLPPRSS